MLRWQHVRFRQRCATLTRLLAPSYHAHSHPHQHLTLMSSTAEIPILSSLLSRTKPCGFAPDGRCIPMESGGLASYVLWLERFVASAPARDHLNDRELGLLSRAAATARAHLQRHPHEGKKLAQRRIEELDALLTSLIPAPSHPLFPVVFPDRLLVTELEQRLATAQPTAPSDLPRSQAAAAAKASKYGVVWQRDDAVATCRLCASPWGIIRRRHHCRACGQLVCDDCSRCRGRVPSSDRPKRICDLCAYAHDKQGQRDGEERDRAADAPEPAPPESTGHSSGGRGGWAALSSLV